MVEDQILVIFDYFSFDRLLSEQLVIGDGEPVSLILISWMKSDAFSSLFTGKGLELSGK